MQKDPKSGFVENDLYRLENRVFGNNEAMRNHMRWEKRRHGKVRASAWKAIPGPKKAFRNSNVNGKKTTIPPGERWGVGKGKN